MPEKSEIYELGGFLHPKYNLVSTESLTFAHMYNQAAI